MRRSWGQYGNLTRALCDSLGGGSRVGLDIDTPDLGVEVECLQGSVSTKVLEDINVLIVSAHPLRPEIKLTSLPP
jgi:hypothetical protein